MSTHSFYIHLVVQTNTKPMLKAYQSDFSAGSLWMCQAVNRGDFGGAVLNYLYIRLRAVIGRLCPTSGTETGDSSTAVPPAPRTCRSTPVLLAAAKRRCAP